MHVDSNLEFWIMEKFNREKSLFIDFKRKKVQSPCAVMLLPHN